MPIAAAKTNRPTIRKLTAKISRLSERLFMMCFMFPSFWLENREVDEGAEDDPDRRGEDSGIDDSFGPVEVWSLSASVFDAALELWVGLTVFAKYSVDCCFLI
jgi:hypothetical protein